MNKRIRNVSLWLLSFALLLSVFVCVGLFAVGADAATGDGAEAGYHVGTNIDLSDDGEVYTDETFTNTGTVAGTHRYADQTNYYIYKAVFAEDADGAWMIFQIVRGAVNMKVEISNDLSDWTTVLESETVNEEGSTPAEKFALPDETDSIRARSSGDRYEYYVDLSGWLAESGASPVYARFSAHDTSMGNGTDLYYLLFTEGNPVNPGGAKFSWLTQDDMASSEGGAPALVTSTMLGWSTRYPDGMNIGCNVDVRIFFDNDAYAVWEVIVPAGTEKVTMEFGSWNDVVVNGASLKVFAGNKQVWAQSSWTGTENNPPIDLTEALSEQLATGEEFRFLLYFGDASREDGNGPIPRVLAFAMDDGSLTAENPVQAPAAAGGGVVYAEENSFDAKEYITEKGIARGNFRDTNGSDGTVEGNEYVAYFKSQYPDDGYPYFDNANFGIFTLEYGANLGAGYLAVDVENTFAVSVSTDAETATAVTGTYAPRFTGYDVLHAETEKQSRDVYYFDVSEYLDPNGGTLYVLLQNGCADCGNGAMLYGMTLGTYAEDAVAFTGTVAGGTIWEGARSAPALSLTKSAYEDVASVSVNGESLAQSDYTVSDDALTLSAAYMASLSAGEYTLTAVSDYADTRTFSASFTVTEDTLLSVALKSAPNKLTYSPGETLDLTGGVLTVTYEGSGVSQVPMTDAAVTVSATAAQQEEGTQTVTVSYGGMSATFTITVEAQADPGTEGEENGTKDPDGGLPAGAIAGIVIACVVVVAGAVTAVVLIRKKKGGKQ